jgi:protein farnesyltransferase subunit beta
VRTSKRQGTRHNNNLTTPETTALTSTNKDARAARRRRHKAAAATMTRLTELIDGHSPTSADFAFDDDDHESDTMHDPVPELFTAPPLIRDALETETSKAQDSVAGQCIGHLAGLVEHPLNEHGVPSLWRQSHSRFLRFNLSRLPGGFVAADSSRPWLLYWSLAALTLLGEDVGALYRDPLVATVAAMSNESGGFGAGSGQTSHLATTYAAVLSIALVGGADAYEVVDRRALWKWLGQLKCPDGGFRMSLGGEEDIR